MPSPARPIALIPRFVAGFYLSGSEGRWIAFAPVRAGRNHRCDRRRDRSPPRRNGVSLGRSSIPIADKLIVAAALLMLASDGTLEGINLIPALVIFCAVKSWCRACGNFCRAAVSLPVTSVAKFRTVMQMIAIAALIAARPGESILPGVTGAALIVLWIAAGLTLYTGYAYLKAGLVHARTEPEKRANPPSASAATERGVKREAALFRLGSAENRHLRERIECRR